jgi:predicted ATPase
LSGKRVNWFVVISGCSGGGKSTLLAELGRRGHSIVDEPGRRIIQEELKSDGSALPWKDGIAFARRAVAMSLADRALAETLDGWVFFDRGLIDAAAAVQRLTGEEAVMALGRYHRFNRRVFFAPPWKEIYRTDQERRHSLEAAVAECMRLEEAYTSLGYEILILPKLGVAERAHFVLKNLGTES